MFREMRRGNQALTQPEIEDILKTETSGVLALAGDDDYPYAVPISYVYKDQKLFFHCARSGHKLDAIKRNPKASFCVIKSDNVVPEEYTTYYKSVIAFGKIKVLEDEGEKRAAIEMLALKYAPNDSPAGRDTAIEREWNAFIMLELSVEHMTGKQAKELIKK